MESEEYGPPVHAAQVMVRAYAGFVIGRKGATIRSIGVETNTYCAVDDTVPGEEVVNITGPSVEAVQAAVDKISEVVRMAAEKGNRAEASYSESLPITRFQAARVIGRGGERVRSIESSTGARIRIISRHGDQRVIVEAEMSAAGESALEQVKAAIAEADAAAVTEAQAGFAGAPPYSTGGGSYMIHRGRGRGRGGGGGGYPYAPSQDADFGGGGGGGGYHEQPSGYDGDGSGFYGGGYSAPPPVYHRGRGGRGAGYRGRGGYGGGYGGRRFPDAPPHQQYEGYDGYGDGGGTDGYGYEPQPPAHGRGRGGYAYAPAPASGGGYGYSDDAGYGSGGGGAGGYGYSAEASGESTPYGTPPSMVAPTGGQQQFAGMPASYGYPMPYPYGMSAGPSSAPAAFAPGAPYAAAMPGYYPQQPQAVYGMPVASNPLQAPVFGPGAVMPDVPPAMSHAPPGT